MTVDIDKLFDQDYLLDTLIALEDILDNTDCYAFFGWLDGEVVDGPIIKKHWISMSLLYPHNRMPDPRAALRLLKLGIKVEFNKVHRSGKAFHPIVDSKQPPNEDQEDTETKIENQPKNVFWLIKLTYPRRLIDQTKEQLDMYDDEVDTGDVESAKDSGIDDETAYDADQQINQQFGGGMNGQQNSEIPPQQ